MRVEGDHEAIIPKELFLQVKSRKETAAINCPARTLPKAHLHAIVVQAIREMKSYRHDKSARSTSGRFQIF